MGRLRPPTCFRVQDFESAALTLCWLAEGRIDAYLNPSDKAWDIAAGALIAREAGATVLGVTGQTWDLRRCGVVACAPGLADAIRLQLGM